MKYYLDDIDFSNGKSTLSKIYFFRCAASFGLSFYEITHIIKQEKKVSDKEASQILYQKAHEYVDSKVCKDYNSFLQYIKQ